MANQPYGTYGSYVSSRLSANPYSSVRNSDLPKYSSSYDYGSSLYTDPSELGSYSTWSGLTSAGLSLGAKRSADALYSQADLGGLNTIGHNALLSSTSMFKHPRIESSSQLPLYPQRPGEKDCAHYMLTRVCKFGEACKFDHPMWVPEGGIPDWKEGLVAPAAEVPPERPGEPDCPHYMKTLRCKFGSRCRFNHPKNNVSAVGDGTETEPSSLLPERPGEPICAFYSKTGNCRFGATCKFHHPKDIQPTEQNLDQAASAAKNAVPFAPALFQNSKGLPLRPGAPDCPFYLKTGSCKYSTTCRYNHPERNEINPLMASSINQAILSSAGLPVSLFNAAANLFPSLNPLFSKTSLGAVSNLYPQRPGQTECDYYMKTGKCTYGEKCRYHHPIDRSATNATPAAGQIQSGEPSVKLTLAGLPRREGAVACPFYMKTGMCKFAVACRYDHPPPGEAVAKATTLGSGAASAEPAV